MHATAPTSTGAPAAALQPVPARKPPLPALTGFRTWLAVSIVLFHFTPAGIGPLYPIVDNGFVFVSFFFLISGFILSYNYLDRPGRLNIRDFWVARMSRLYPIYLVSLLLFAEMLHSEWLARSHKDFWEGTVASIFLVQGFFPNLATFWNTVAWTLSCEIALYALFPLLMRVPWPSRPSRIIAVLLGFWMLGVLPHLVYLVLNPDHFALVSANATPSAAAQMWTSTRLHLQLADTNRFSSGFWINFLKYTPTPYLCTFLAGIALGKLQTTLRLSAKKRLAVCLGGFAWAWFTFYVVIGHLPYVMIHGGLLTPVFATLIIGLSGRHPVSRFFSWKPLVTIGSSTYCLYLLHFNVFVLIHMHNLPERLHVARFDPWISYAAVIVLAVCARQWIERPCQVAIANWWKQRKLRQQQLAA